MTKVAYLILAHKEPEQLARLIRRLGQPGARFFVHIDAKASLAGFAACLSALPEDVTLVRERENGLWGDLGIVKATINGLEQIGREFHDFDHVVLLSGQDYPIKSAEEITDFFDAHRGTTFMEREAYPVARLRGGGLHRVHGHTFTFLGKRRTYHPRANRPRMSRSERLINLVLGARVAFMRERVMPLEMKPYYGSQWWSMSRETARDVVEFVRRTPGYVRFYEHALLPDEGFFQTIVMNTDVAEETVDDNLRLVVFEPRAPHPVTLDETRMDQILGSKALFARKFEPGSPVLDAIDEVVHR